MRIGTTGYRNNKYNNYTLLESMSYNTNRIQIHSDLFRKKSTLVSSLKHNKNRLDHESFYQSKIKKILHLSLDDYKNEPDRLKLTSNKGTNKKLVNF